jgi:chromate transporter
MSRLPALAAIFGQLSLLAFGGGNSILPEMQRQVTSTNPWMTGSEFAALFALGQAAPGPNILLVAALIGWQVAGLAGALVATSAFCAPSSILTFVCAGLWDRLRATWWRPAVQAGLAPVTAGLVMAGALLLIRSTMLDWRGAMLIAVATALFIRSRINPLLVLAAAAALGAAGLLG